MKKRLLAALIALVIALAMPLSTAWAASGDLDEILDYRITVNVNNDATLAMTYHIRWKVLDSTSEGPLTWVRVGIPNKHYVSMKTVGTTARKISYDSKGGSYARIDLDRAYRAGEVADFSFQIVQDYMYQVGRDNQGEAVYEFTPGWFDDIVVDNLEVRWNADKVERITPAAKQEKGYYTWSKPLRKGERFTVTVGYEDDAYAFDVDKTIAKGNAGSTSSSSDDEGGWIYGLVAVGMLIFFGWAAISFVWSVIRGVADLFNKGRGFTMGKKITRTKVVYYPSCQGCGAVRPEGKDTCEYCGRSFVKSEEVISEKDIPPAESAIKAKDTDGEYAYRSEPNTFLRVHVIPAIVSSGGSGRSRSRSSGGGRSCACASSCACACGCACACACAGGGRAGCSTKDFYNTDLKLSQLARKD